MCVAGGGFVEAAGHCSTIFLDLNNSAHLLQLPTYQHELMTDMKLLFHHFIGAFFISVKNEFADN
jgi:hypothetical protein